jgi:hypothetical protein
MRTNIDSLRDNRNGLYTRSELVDVLLELASRVEDGHNMGLSLLDSTFTTRPYRTEDGEVAYSVQTVTINWGTGC